MLPNLGFKHNPEVTLDTDSDPDGTPMIVVDGCYGVLPVVSNAMPARVGKFKGARLAYQIMVLVHDPGVYR